MNETEFSLYHGHEIILSAAEEACYFCSYPASHKVEEENDGSTHPYTAYVCCDHFWANCSNTFAPSCDICGHPWYNHETEIKLADQTVHECNAYAGMGDWCGCKNPIPEEYKNDVP